MYPRETTLPAAHRISRQAVPVTANQGRVSVEVGDKKSAAGASASPRQPTLRRRMLFKVFSNQVLVVSRNFSEGDARPLVREVVDNLAFAIDICGVLRQAKRYSKRLVRQGRQRREDKAPAPADLPDSAVEGVLSLINQYLQVCVVTSMLSLVDSGAGHYAVSYAARWQSQHALPRECPRECPAPLLRRW